MTYVNGHRCHEAGCPEAWRDYGAECRWCGTQLEPEYRGQTYCCPGCAASDRGEDLPGECDDTNWTCPRCEAGLPCPGGCERVHE